MLTRELGDGAAIVVTRRWCLAFSAAEAGILVGGEQTFSEVAAPPALAAFAALEKARSTSGLFPIRLDPMGHIAGSERGMDAAHLMRAIEAARALVERDAARPGARRDAHSFMAQLAGMGAQAVSTIPRDLFFPSPERSSATRQVALPNGDTGMISIDTAASVHAETGLLRTSERVIVTRIGPNARTSRESWALTPLR